jgi:phage terminase large subunit-like protein
MGEFSRSYLNLWGDDRVNSVIPVREWNACNIPSAISGSIVIAVDVSPMSTNATVAVAGMSTNGGVPTIGQRKTHISIVKNFQGTAGVVEEIVRLKNERESAGVAIRGVVLDDAGPAGELVQPLRLAGIEVHTIGTRGLVQACGGLYSAVRDGTITHMGDPIMLKALKAAAKRELGDAWAWGRKASASDITPLVAATIARWGDLELPEPERTDILVSWG